MKMKHHIMLFLLSFLLILTSSFIHHVCAETSKEPDKVDIITITREDLHNTFLLDDRTIDYHSETWDMTKNIQVTYDNLIFSAFLSNDGTESWIHQVSQVKAGNLKRIDFPEMIQGLPVTKLGSAKYILENDAYYTIMGNCVEPYHGVSGYRSIPQGITTITLPSSVSTIDTCCFCGFSELTSIVIPDGVKRIEYSTFYDCKNLKELTLPASLESIEDNAFKKCKSLDTIHLSESNANFVYKNHMLLSKDETTLFWVQPKLSKLNIPAGILSIDKNALLSTYATEISIPQTVVYLENDNLPRLSLVKKFTISSKNPKYTMVGGAIALKQQKKALKETMVDFDLKSQVIDEFISKESLEALQKEWDLTQEIQVTDGPVLYRAFLSKDEKRCWIHDVDITKKCASAKLNFPDFIHGVPVTNVYSSKTIFGSVVSHCILGNGSEPFHGGDGYDNIPCKITEVTLPVCLLDLGSATFCGFRDLRKIVIPDGVSEINYATFYNCTSLTEATLPSSLETFHFEMFKKCKKLTTIRFATTALNYQAKNGCLFTKNGKTLVWAQPGIKKLTIPSGTTRIGENATLYSYVTEIYIPKTVTSIKKGALSGPKLKTIKIDSKNPRYGVENNCVYSKKTHRLVSAICTSGTLKLPNQVYYLTDNICFVGKEIDKIIFPTTFKKLGTGWNENYLVSYSNLYFNTKTPPEADPDTLHSCEIIVPKGSLRAYSNWASTLGTKYSNRIKVSEQK